MKPKEPTEHELNLFTAQKVMGWKNSKSKPTTTLGQFQEWDRSWITYHEDYGGSWHQWSPATDRAQSQMVLDKCIIEAAMRVREKSDRRRSRQ